MKFILIPCALLMVTACAPRVVDTQNPNLTGDASHANGTQINYIDTPFLDANGNQVYDETGAPVYVQTPAATGAIQDNPNEIVLSNFSQEQQKRDREAYAAQQAAIAAQRVEVTAVDVAQTPTVSVAAFARSTTNQIGQKLYARSGKRGSCSAYASVDAAQRAFLEAGGPQNDRLGLDPDGDGFACKFDPSVYRSIRF